jgi:hypothetical protein
MTVGLKHKFVSGKADAPDTDLIRPSNWNDEHDLTLATDRLLGRDTVGDGLAEEIIVTGGLEFTGTGGIQRSGLTGDVTAPAGSNTTTIANDSVTYAKMQNVTTNNRLIGRGSSGAGDPEEITVGTGLTLSGTTLSTAANYAPLASPTFTGTPAAPTASAYTDSTQIATTGNVSSTVKTVPNNVASIVSNAYTLVLTDAGKLVELSSGSAITLNIPTHATTAFPQGTRIDIVQIGAGQVTVGGSGVTIRSSNSKLKLNGQWSGATLWKKADDEWYLIGDIAT